MWVTQGYAALAHRVTPFLEGLRSAFATSTAADLELRARLMDEELPQLIDLLRDLQRLGRDSILLRTEPTELPELARTALGRVSSLRKFHGIEFVLDQSSATGTAALDGGLLARAIEQLLENAASACLARGSASGTVTLAIERREKAVLFTVEDQGLGVPPDELEHLVAGRFRSRRRSYGFGLGLEIALRVVDAHGGGLEVWSEPDFGSAFRFALPQG